ncbi:MAG TPA: SBBP repeat-containing protein [bacterium]
MSRFNAVTFFTIAFLFLISCSNSSGPISPDIDAPSITGTKTTLSSSGNTVLWGLWDVHINFDTGSIEAVPMRGATFAANVVKFIDSPPSNLILSINGIDQQAEYIDVDVNVGLRHPFAGLDQYIGFDVAGIFMGNGSASGPDGLSVAGIDDQVLMNPDGFTRWFNATEFSSAGSQIPLIGYTPGKLGTTGYTPGAILNPYKYFADGLGSTEEAFDFLTTNPSGRGSFTPGTVNTRNYLLRFPTTTGVTFQYAVAAHWEPNANDPNPPGSLDDFPISANADEAMVVSVIDQSDLFYIDGSTYGGNVRLQITPSDWSAECSTVADEYEIILYSDVFTSPKNVDMTPVGNVGDFCTFEADFPSEVPASDDKSSCWIRVSQLNADYSNDFGVSNDATGPLSSYFLIDIPVSGDLPGSISVIDPNGGENLQTGGNFEIKWTSENVAGNVNIEYSKDNFESDVNEIVASTENDGSYIWTSIPDDPTTSGRVRISAESSPSIFDISDADFTIESANGWVLTWGASGNDRGYGMCTDDDGNFYVTGFYFSTVDFDPSGGTDFHPGFGSWDSFVSKFDAEGNYQWAATWGATGYADSAREVAVDSSGNVYVCGWWQNNLSPAQIDLDPGPSQDWFYGTVGDNGYVIKLDSTGAYQWGASWNAADWEWFDCYGIAVDIDGNVWLSGSFQGANVDLDPTSGVDPVTTVGGGSWRDAFLIKLDTDGNYEFGYNWGGGFQDYGQDIIIDSAGNAVVTGSFAGVNVDFDPGVPTAFRGTTGDFDLDVYVTSFDSTGAHNWVKSWGSSSSEEGYGLAVDQNGNILVSGYFAGSCDFDPDGAGDVHNTNGGSDAFVCRLDSSGTFDWAETWGGTGADVSYGVTADNLGGVGVTGYFEYTVDFDISDPGGQYTFTANTNHDSFYIKFDSDSTFGWAHAWGGIAQSSGGGVEDEGWSTVTDLNGNFMVAGVFQNTCDFEPGAGVTNKTAGTNDVFLMKLLPDGTW